MLAVVLNLLNQIKNKKWNKKKGKKLLMKTMIDITKSGYIIYLVIF